MLVYLLFVALHVGQYNMDKNVTWKGPAYSDFLAARDESWSFCNSLHTSS